MNTSEACEIYNKLPEPCKLILRNTARRSLQDQNFAEIGSSDTSGECFRLIMSGEYGEILGLQQCGDCKQWVESLPEDSEICQDCIDAGSICSACNGSGEGMYDGSTCRSCGGSGDEYHPYGRSRRGSQYDPDREREEVEA